MVESVEEFESDFKANCEDYIKYLRENVDMTNQPSTYVSTNQIARLNY